MKYFVSILVFFALIAISYPAMAQSAFSWTDHNGNTHYGNNPPKDAKDVKSIGRNISRYNTNLVLRRLQGGSAKMASANQITEKNIPLTPVLTNEGTIIEKLEQQNLQLELDDQNRITSCAVSLKNTAAVPINNVSVLFSFPDGSKIIADGPKILRDGSEVTYYAPSKQLPISLNASFLKEKIKEEDKNNKEVVKTILSPKIIVGIE